MRWLIKRKKSDTVLNKASRILPPHQYYPLRTLWPAIHLECFDRIILASLEQFHGLLSSILIRGTSSNLQEITAFDQKYQDILQAFNYLKDSSHKLNQYSNDTQLAIWLFVFYRILYCKESLALLPNQNNHFFLKRLSPTLIWYLNSEYWRLFELALIIEGDLSHLILNQDIEEWIDAASGLVTPSPAEQVQTKLNDKNLEVDSNQGHQASQETNSETIPIPNSDNPPMEINKNEGKVFNQFIHWLDNKINSQDKRFRINRGDFCFAKLLNKNHQTLFITESLLLHYQAIQGVCTNFLFQLLTEKNASYLKQYALKQQQENILLFRIDEIPILKTPDCSTTILEISNENETLITD